jgi:hypothetical protein
MNDTHERLETLAREVKIISEHMRRNFPSLSHESVEKYGIFLTYLRYLEDSVGDVKKSLGL